MQWLPTGKHNHGNIKVEIRMPDSTIIRGMGEPELKNLNPHTQLQFERVGFVSLYKKHQDKLEFWFTHR